ncbi:hypothetical protein ACQ4PT_054970 [Festuca glaucescens]
MVSLAHLTPGSLQATRSELSALQDELLEEIFLRLPAAADLDRASMACPTFLRVITHHPFLRHFRTLHPPPQVGIISVTFCPTQPPHSSASAAKDFANADVDFLLQKGVAKRVGSFEYISIHVADTKISIRQQ